MTRGNRNLALLALVAAALVAAVLGVGRRDYLRDLPTLTAINPAHASRVQLDIPPLAARVFAKRADGWWRIKPAAARADPTRVQRLARLAATPVVRWLPAAKVVPARVGLAPPSATLVVDGKRLEYGGLTAIGNFRYVRVGNKLALVPRQYSPEVMLSHMTQHP